MQRFELNVNGVARAVQTDAKRPLLETLRDDLELTGTKYGCGEGACGACTVWIDGVPTRSCITAVGTVGAKRVTTIEALAAGGKLHPLQEAFIECEAMQCAYCTSGMLMTAAAFLSKTPDPSEAQIKDVMNGNICRCCVYGNIVNAVQLAAKRMKERRA